MEAKCKGTIGPEVYQQNAFHPLRVESVTEQLRLLSYAGYTSVLEVGIGVGFLRHCLTYFPSISHVTFDLDERLSPDYVGTVTNMPFSDSQFDVVLCCEVLEHLPFGDFPFALRELNRVAKNTVILSLPDKTRHFGVAVCFARLGWFTYEYNPARRRFAKGGLGSNSEHYWEIGCKGSLTKHVLAKINKAGFRVERHYRLWKHPWHHFFLLNK